MPEKRICAGCLKEYWWPGAKWQHDDCVVVNADVVVNTEPSVVVNARTKDRHRNTDERKEYVRKKMREYRARKKG